ncbi:MAG: EAL domain-containing protein [Wujia sp.]
MKESEIDEIKEIIDNKALYPVYQPIVSLLDGRIVAYEALSRISLENATVSILQLFEGAAVIGRLWELEKLCRTEAIKNATSKPKGVKLFINIDGNLLQDKNFESGFTKEKLEKYSLSAKDIVFEVTERSDFENCEKIRKILKHYESQGYEVALDDLGAGYSGLNRLQNIQPKYVKIDYELIHDIHKDKSKRSLIRMLVHYCDSMGYELIAEGIEKEEELECLINNGVLLGQGYLLGRPEKSFEDVSQKIKNKILHYQKDNKNKKNNIGDICKMGMVLYPSCNIEHARSIFTNNNLDYIAVVDNKCRFYGLIYRNDIISGEDNRRDYRENLETIMNTDVLIIDSEKSLKYGVGKLMSRGEKRIMEPFVVLKKDRYYGIATVWDILVALGRKL